MFRASSLPIIRSYLLYPLPCVQQITPDDGHRSCPKHAEFYDNTNFGCLMHLVGRFIRYLLRFVSFLYLLMSGFQTRVILADKLTLEQVSVQVLPFRFASIIPPMLHNHLRLNSNAFCQTSESPGQKITLSVSSSLCHTLYVLFSQSSLSHSYSHTLLS
jgi:hypothetical protein